MGIGGGGIGGLKRVKGERWEVGIRGYICVCSIEGGRLGRFAYIMSLMNGSCFVVLVDVFDGVGGSDYFGETFLSFWRPHCAGAGINNLRY